DIKNCVSTIYNDDLGDLIKAFCIPLNLHSRLHDPMLTMDRLPHDSIGVYFESLLFSGVRIPFLTFLLLVLGYFKEHILQLVPLGLNKVIPFEDHTTAPVAEGALILLPTSDEDAAAQPDPRLARRKRVHEVVSSNPEVEQIEDLGDAHISSFYVELKDSLERSGGIPVRVVFTPLPHLVDLMESLGFEDVRRCSNPLDTLARSALSRDAEYDQILEDDFVFASRGEEIDMTFFPIAPGLNVIPIRLMVTLLLHTLNNNGMVLICRRIISCARIFSEIQIALLVSYGMELNNRYSNLVAHRSCTQEKLDRKSKDLQNELPLERSKSQEYKDVAKGLRTEVTYFVGSAVECLVRRLLSSDEFHAALAHVSTLAAEFNKSLDALPSTPFLFLHKVVAAASGALSEVTQILPDKLIRPIAPVSTMPHVVNEALNQAHVDHASDDLPYNLGSLYGSSPSDVAIHQRAYLLGREDFMLPPFPWFRFNRSASSFSSSSLLIIRLVGTPISAGSHVYFLNYILSCYGPMHRSSGHRIPFSMYSYIGVIQVHAASSTIVFTLAMSIEHSLSSSINTPFVSPLHCTLRFIMDDPNITMEEYIRLEEEKAQRHGQTFNWQTATYGNEKYCEDDDDCFTNFKAEFLAIVFDDTLTSDAALSCEHTLSPLNENKINFRISFDESDDEDYTLDKDNNDDEIHASGDMVPLPPRDQRHPWLRYQVEGYTKDIMHNYEHRLDTIFGTSVNRVHVLDFVGLTKEMRETLAGRLRMVYTRNEGQELFTSHAWRRLFEIKGPISGRGQTPEKVTGIDLFYLRRMDYGTANVPYLLAQFLFMHAEGRKSGARLFKGHFIGHLAAHFGLVSDERLRGLLVITQRQSADVSRAPEDAEGAHDEVEGDKAVLAPVQAPHPPPFTLDKTITQRLSMLEEEVHSLRGDLGEQKGVLDSMACDFSRFTTWIVTSLSRMIDQSGVRYTSYSDSQVPYQRRTRCRTGDANTSTAQQDQQQPYP
nr:hypothetical protein [Tanacetum cinerariifolium]